MTDSKTLVKCVLPIMKEEESGKDDMTDDDEANQLAGCIVRSAWKKQQEGSDNAGNMVRRYLYFIYLFIYLFIVVVLVILFIYE